jgi:sec-independent protein translocase protein TatA
MLDTVVFGYIGTQEILICAGVVVLLFGGAKLPQLAKGLGEGIREFKKSVNHDEPPVEPPTEKAEIKDK